jgi:recombinational DNA repair protein (RecF pathway)
LPAVVLHTEAFVLLKRPPAEKFQSCTLFSPEHGLLPVFVRLSSSASRQRLALDLFEEAAVQLETSNQGRTWFLREARMLASGAAIGRSYEALRAASAFASLIARNSPAEQANPRTGALLRAAFAAFGGSADPEVVLFKSVYRFARDEGHPLPQQWLPSLPAELRATAEHLLRTPLADLGSAAATPAALSDLQRRLEEYLRGYTELLLDDRP